MFGPVSQPSPSREELELLAAVKSDLVFLEDEWDETIDEQSLRRGSTVLRNLLVDNALGRAWRLIGQKGEPEIEAVDLTAALAGLRMDKVIFAAAGGGVSGGVQLSGGMVYAEAMDEQTVKERYERRGGRPPMRLYRVSQFLSSPAIVVDGERISRHLVIKYVANKKGGAHFDFKRKKDEAAYRLLDKVTEEGYALTDKDAVYFELLSIGQALAGSAHATRLRRLIT
jgi:hypothetical protein